MCDVLFLEWWYYGPCFVTYERILPCQSRHSTEGVDYEGWGDVYEEEMVLGAIYRLVAAL